jgi:site-specific recombinase XerD
MDPDIESDGSERVGEFVRIYRRKQNGVWYANFQHGKRQCRESLKTTNKKVAQRLARQIDGKLLDGLWKPAIEAVSLVKTIDLYIEMLRVEGRAVKTMAKYVQVLRRIGEFAAGMKISELTDCDLRFIDAYRKKRSAEKAAAKTKHVEITIFRQLIKFALSRNLLAENPLKGLTNKRPKPTKQPCFTPTQTQAILENAPETVRPSFVILAETGLRFGELAWLTWDDIDFEANTLCIQPKTGWTTKSGDQRTMPLSVAARAALEALPRTWRWVVTMPPSAKYPVEGRQWTERRLLTALKGVLKTLKLPGKLHTFRHAFISRALVNGIPLAVLKEWVGHIDPKVTALYTHIDDEASQAAMKRLSVSDPPKAAE